MLLKVLIDLVSMIIQPTTIIVVGCVRLIPDAELEHSVIEVLRTVDLNSVTKRQLEEQA